MLKIQIQSQGQFKVAIEHEFAASITAVFGPSGSGKSTMLRAIAGMEPTKGLIQFAGVDWLNSDARINVKPHARAIGYVRQNAQLLPHLSVRGNLTYASRHTTREGHVISLDQAIEDFNLSDLLERQPTQLSGGETQRVVLARMLLANPRLLLLDEPLTGLDYERKAEIVPYLKRLCVNYSLPTLYVSHLVDEVTALCENALILNHGRVQASGLTSDVVVRHDLDKLVGASEISSILRARVVEHDRKYALTTLKVENHTWSIPGHDALDIGTEINLRVRARDVSLARTAPSQISIRNMLLGKVVEIHPIPNSHSVDCILLSGKNTRLRAQITRASLDDLALNIGDEVVGLVKSVTLSDS